MAFSDIINELVLAYDGFSSILPLFFQTFFNFFFLALLIFLYAVFIWKFHRFVSHKNIFNLNLGKYSSSGHPVLAKFSAIGLYLLEYIIIMPIIIFFWFSIFGISLIIFTDLQIDSILVISTIIVAAIRITAYSNEGVAKEVAKLLPLTLLATAITNSEVLDFSRVLENLSQISGFFSVILNYLMFIVVLETILRFFDFLFSLLNIKE